MAKMGPPWVAAGITKKIAALVTQPQWVETPLKTLSLLSSSLSHKKPTKKDQNIPFSPHTHYNKPHHKPSSQQAGVLAKSASCNFSIPTLTNPYKQESSQQAGVLAESASCNFSILTTTNHTTNHRVSKQES